jgi:hypothetical protein
MHWDEKLSARLVELWQWHSASDIAAIFVVEGYPATRHSVIGRIFRMGLSGKKKAIVRPRHIKPKYPKIARDNEAIGRSGRAVQAINRANRKIEEPPARVEAFTPRVSGVMSMRKTLVELGPYGLECRWADDERDEDGMHTFCGHPANGHSYCAAHRNLAIDHSRMARIKSTSSKPVRVAA